MFYDEELSVFQKVILAILAAMAVIFAVWTAVNRAKEGVFFREDLLKAETLSNGTRVYSGQLYGTAVTITCREENGTKLVNFSADGKYYAQCRVEYPEGTIQTEFGKNVPRIRILRNDEVLFSGGYDPDPASQHLKYFSENGKWDAPIVISASGSGDPWHFFAFSMSDIMRFANEPGLSARGSWGIYFLVLFCSLLTAAEVALPYTIFHLRYCLSVYNPEPTDLYLFCHKAASVILVIVLLVYYIKGLTTFV